MRRPKKNKKKANVIANKHTDRLTIKNKKNELLLLYFCMYFQSFFFSLNWNNLKLIVAFALTMFQEFFFSSFLSCRKIRQLTWQTSKAKSLWIWVINTEGYLRHIDMYYCMFKHIQHRGWMRIKNHMWECFPFAIN